MDVVMLILVPLWRQLISGQLYFELFHHNRKILLSMVMECDPIWSNENHVKCKKKKKTQWDQLDSLFQAQNKEEKNPKIPHVRFLMWISLNIFTQMASLSRNSRVSTILKPFTSPCQVVYVNFIECFYPDGIIK